MRIIQEVLHSLQIGEAATHKGLAMHPLCRDGEVGERIYLTLDEALKEGVLTIEEVSDSGSVNHLLAQNNGDKPVFLMEGEQLVGAKQNRSLNISLLVPAHKSIVVPVSCVEQGRWSPGKKAFAASGETLFWQARELNAEAISRSLDAVGNPSADQAGMWRVVERKLAETKACSPTSAMEAAYGKRRKNLDDFVAALSPVEGQVGALFSFGNRFAGMDLFDHPQTLRLFLLKLVRSYAMDVPAEGRLGDAPDASQARLLLDNLAASGWSVRPTAGLGEWARIESSRYAGGALLHDGRVIHMFVSVRSPSEEHDTEIARFRLRGWRTQGE